MSTKILKYSTPLECYQKIFPLSRMYSNLPLKVFGCSVFVHLPNHNWSKLDPRAEKCVFIGYASNKKGYKCYNPQTRKMYESMDVSFIEDKSFFNKNSLQGENDVIKEIFWDSSPTPLPNTILTTTPPLIYNPEEQCDKTDKNSSHIMPNIIVSEIRRESIQPNIERLVYTQRKTHQKSQSQHVPLGNDKSGPSRTEAPDITGSPTLNLPSIPFISSLDLDIPIALRKGTLTCTKYPIAKYLSYKKLFKTHKAFTSKISHILVPRNIQEALDDPNWKVAVMKEMNALKRSGTWELVDLPKEKRTVGCK